MKDVDFVREQVLKGMAVAPVPFTEDELTHLTNKVLARDTPPDNLKHFAYCVGRNWVLDRQRASRNALKRQLIADQKEAERAAAREAYVAAREEFTEISVELLANQSDFKTKMLPQHLEVVRLSKFAGVSDDRIREEFFPGKSRDVIHQWKCRGTKMVLGFASVFLSEWLETNKWQRG